MDTKTTVQAVADRQDLLIQRVFELPLEWLFKAYTDRELLAEWMGTQVLQLDCRPQGAYALETRDAEGRVVFSAQGVIHSLVPERSIVRTFEMAGAGFGPQLEFLDFEALDAERSQLRVHSIFRTPALRDAQLRLPFAFGINMAHNRLQERLNLYK